MISIDNYLGLDKRGNSAYYQMRENFKNRMGSPTTNNDSPRRNRRLDLATGLDSPVNNKSFKDMEELKDLHTKGLFPCDRTTIFGPAGSHAIYRSRKYDDRIQNFKMLDQFRMSSRRRLSTLAVNHGTLDNIKENTLNFFRQEKNSTPGNDNWRKLMTTTRFSLALSGSAEKKKQQEVKLFKSQLNVPEYVRKYSSLIRQAQKKLEEETKKYQHKTMQEQGHQMHKFKQTVKKIPEEFLDKEIKKKLVKTRENMNFRAMQAKIVEKTCDEWCMTNLIKKVKEERKEKIRLEKQNALIMAEHH